MIGYLLFLVARTIVILGMPFGVIYTVVRRVILKKAKTLGGYYVDMAYLYDVLVNVCYGDFLNDVLKKWDAYQYGDKEDSISLVLGRNKALQRLTRFEKWVADQLNKLDKDHVEKAAQ